MRSKAIFMALLALAFGAQAEPVSQSDAASVARAWMQRNVRHHGRAKVRPMRVRKAMTHKTSDGTEFHSFRMQGGGTVITSGDTENAPVIAFTPKDLDLSAVDPKSPLWALLNRDLSQRGKGRLLQNGAAERHRGRWSELRRHGAAAQVMSAASIANEEEEGEGEGDFEPSDIRVPALVKSKWAQGTIKVAGNEIAVWNYYTPNSGDPEKFVPGAKTNVVCGCVATAMSQLMRYHEWPHSTTQITRQCSWAGSANYKMKLRTKAGDFDWAKMPFAPDGEITEEQRQAIGKLTSDAGISVYMMYNDIGKDGKPSGESGAFSFDIPDALKAVWGYGSAVMFAAADTTITATTPQTRAKAMKGVLFANFDAGLPVLMGISGAGGHQIVADGYGFDETEVDYVHLNMGWADENDIWYNLPDIKIGNGGFNVVNDIVYNVMTNGTDSTAIISGRVTDEAGIAVSNAAVKVLSGTAVVATAATSETGVWGVPVRIVGNQTDFSIRVDSQDGLRYGTIAKSTVKRPQPGSITVNGVGYKLGKTTTETVRSATVQQVKDVDKVGNSWGNDVVLAPAPAQIVMEDGAVTNVFYTLDDALAAAAKSEDPVTIKIVAPITLGKDAAVGGVCMIAASDPSAIVTVAKDAAIEVAVGGALALEGVVFTNALGTADAELVTVAAGGTLELGADVVLYGRITTESDDGLVLAGELKSPVFLECKAAPDICQTFGSIRSGAAGEVRDSATNIVNWAEKTHEIVGFAEECDTLRWDERPLTLEEAVGYYVTDDGATTNLSRRLDRLIAQYAFADVEAPIVLLADDTLTLALTLQHDLVFSAPEGSDIAITVAPTARFTVPDGVSMSVTGVSFTGNGEQGNGLFLVEGGDLTLGEGTVLSGLIGTSSDLGSPNSGAVNVMSGTLTLTDGAEISGCEVTSYYNRPQNGYGGGVYLDGEGCSLVLAGGRITGCRAQTYGGGVYVRKGATVSLFGETTVIGNLSGNKTVAETRADDIYMAYAELGDFTLDGPVSGKIGVRWGESSTDRNVAGTEFITVAGGVDPTSSLTAFVSDVNPGLAAGKGTGTLKWNAGSSNAKYLLTVVANDLTKFKDEADPELTYSVYGQKNPPATLSGTLEREAGEEVGTYAISQGTLDVIGTDYRLEFVGGTLTIVESPLPPPPPPPPPPEPYWEVVTTNPTPIAFQSIDRVNDTEWALTVTNRVRYCNYRLLWTTDLTKGFVATGDWEHVVHENCEIWTTNVITSGGAYFWRAEGKDGTNMVLHVEE